MPETGFVPDEQLLLNDSLPPVSFAEAKNTTSSLLKRPMDRSVVVPAKKKKGGRGGKEEEEYHNDGRYNSLRLETRRAALLLPKLHVSLPFERLLYGIWDKK